jgi:Reverse transcriptase (RNA-dependent DNA polymerase)
LNQLDDSDLKLQLPEGNQYTCFSDNGGSGIPDLIFSTFKLDNVHVLQEDMMYSDHAPIIFEVNLTNYNIHRDFTRWNIRKFSEQKVREQYIAKLQETSLEIYERLNYHMNIDQGWDIFKQWIENAAYASCGTFTFKWKQDKEIFDEETLKIQNETRKAMCNLQEIVNNPNMNRTFRQRAQRTFVILQQELKKQIASKSKSSFDKMVRDMADPQNTSTFMRMVRCNRNRRLRKSSQLTTDKIDHYADHFLTTFGAEPQGKVDTERCIPQDYYPSFYFEEEILNACKNLAYGKAPGVDALFGEFFIIGAPVIAKVLQRFFMLIHIHRTVPLEWTTSLIHLVYKKGDARDVANYRPISLTCVVRRIYERCLQLELDPFIPKLNEIQGGFLKGRSSLHQVYVLQEIVKENPNMHNIFMDIKAAYDTVDRRILWNDMLTYFGIPFSTVDRIRSLFENNVSRIVLNGKKSKEILNRRGLLQGSSLSPILFNFFIDSLARRLDSCMKISTRGIRTNALLFADDLNIHGSIDNLKVILKTCEDWTKDVGIRFAPSKCVYVSELQEQNDFRIYGESISCKNDAPYLGVTFNSKGIDFLNHIQLLKDRTIQIIHLLAKIGFNVGGWLPSSSRIVYKTFIRSSMEYGLQLQLLPKYQLEVLQKVQNQALRTMFSMGKKTSIAAMHRLAQLETVETRNEVINARFFEKIHAAENREILAHRIWDATFTRSKMRKNSFWQMGHLNDYNTTTMAMKKEFIKHSIVNYGKDNGKIANYRNIGATVLVEMQDNIRKILWIPHISNEARIAIIRWILGGVVRHQPCLNCNIGEELNRLHAMECSGANLFLREHFGNIILTAGETLLDAILNWSRNEKKSYNFYQTLYKAICMIYEKCLRYQKKANGFWTEGAETLVGLAAVENRNRRDEIVLNQNFQERPCENEELRRHRPGI